MHSENFKDLKVMQLKDKTTIPTMAGASATNEYEGRKGGKRRLHKNTTTNAFSHKNSFAGEYVQITG